MTVLAVEATTDVGSPLLNIAIFGGAVIPLLTGMLADASGSLAIALILPALCYAVILAYGLYARRPLAARGRLATRFPLASLPAAWANPLDALTARAPCACAHTFKSTGALPA